jgi:uroporphyrinogen decarboxylase
MSKNTFYGDKDMNNLQLFKATVNHQQHDGWLCYASFTPALMSRLLAKYGLSSEEELKKSLHMRAWAPVAPSFKAGYTKPDFSRYYAGMDIPDGAFINGLGVLEVPANYYHFTGYVSPLRAAESIKEIEAFPYPSAENLDFSEMQARVKKAHRHGQPVGCFVGHMYECAWAIRGYEEFLLDMLSKPAACEYILDRLCEQNIRCAEEAARAGVDIILSGDDVANQRSLMFSPNVWRSLLKSRWAKVYQAARRINPDIQIWYHSDGNIMDIIPELIDIGVTILNPVQPECLDIEEVKRRFGRHLVLDGTIGTQTVMPFGSPAKVKETVLRMKKIAGHDGALILSPTHILEPEVPIENIEAFFEACLYLNE